MRALIKTILREESILNEGTKCQEAAQAGINDCFDTHWNNTNQTMGPGYQDCHDTVMTTLHNCNNVDDGMHTMPDGTVMKDSDMDEDEDVEANEQHSINANSYY